MTPIPFKTHSLLNNVDVAHGFFGRRGGVSPPPYESLNLGRGSLDRPENVTENRRRVAASLGAAPEQLVSLWQCHSQDVIIIDAPFGDNRPKADGLVTKTPGLALSALSADCGPVLFHEPQARIIGACHAGWRGALSGITEATIAAMEMIGAKRAHIHAVLGPCISQNAYEVGPEFQAEFTAQTKSYDEFFTYRPALNASENRENAPRPHFDLKAFILHRLKTSGLTHIDSLPDCTYQDADDYFSYRYNTHHGIEDYGRNISAIMLTR